MISFNIDISKEESRFCLFSFIHLHRAPHPLITTYWGQQYFPELFYRTITLLGNEVKELINSDLKIEISRRWGIDGFYLFSKIGN